MAEPSYYLLHGLKDQPRIRENWAPDLSLVLERINAIENLLDQPQSTWYNTDPDTGTFYGDPFVSAFAHPRINTFGAPKQWYLRDRIDQLRSIGNVAPFPWKYMPNLADYTARFRTCALDARQILEMLQAIGRVTRTGAESTAEHRFYYTRDGDEVSERIEYNPFMISGYDYIGIATKARSVNKKCEVTTRYDGKYSGDRTETHSGSLPFEYAEGWPTRWDVTLHYATTYEETKDVSESQDPRWISDIDEEHDLSNCKVTIYDRHEGSGDFTLDRIEQEAPHLLIYALRTGGTGSVSEDDISTTRYDYPVYGDGDFRGSYSLFTNRPHRVEGEFPLYARTPEGALYNYFTWDWVSYISRGRKTVSSVGFLSPAPVSWAPPTSTTQDWDLVQSDTIPTTLSEIENAGTVISISAAPTERYLWLRPRASFTSMRDALALPDLVHKWFDNNIDLMNKHIFTDKYTAAEWGEAANYYDAYPNDEGVLQPGFSDKYPYAWHYISNMTLWAVTNIKSTISISAPNGIGNSSSGKTWLCWSEPYIPNNWPDTLKA